MKTTRTAAASSHGEERQWAETRHDPRQPGFVLTTTMVVREDRFFPLSRDGRHSIGQMIDRRIAEVFEMGDCEMQDINVHINEETWRELRLNNAKGGDPLYNVAEG